MFFFFLLPAAVLAIERSLYYGTCKLNLPFHCSLLGQSKRAQSLNKNILTLLLKMVFSICLLAFPPRWTMVQDGDSIRELLQESSMSIAVTVILFVFATAINVNAVASLFSSSPRPAIKASGSWWGLFRLSNWLVSFAFSATSTMYLANRSVNESSPPILFFGVVASFSYLLIFFTIAIFSSTKATPAKEEQIKVLMEKQQAELLKQQQLQEGKRQGGVHLGYEEDTPKDPVASSAGVACPHTHATPSSEPTVPLTLEQQEKAALRQKFRFAVRPDEKKFLSPLMQATTLALMAVITPLVFAHIGRHAAHYGALWTAASAAASSSRTASRAALTSVVSMTSPE